MEYSTVTKKKKRRTRKCLDEIRKRSRRSMMRVNCTTEISQQCEKMKKSKGGHASDVLITVNRLTLNMFPKAIRSETITRPLLEEIKQKSSNNYQSLKINTSSLQAAEVECYNSAASNNSMPMFDLEEESRQDYGSSPIGIPLGGYLNSHILTPVNISETPADIAKVYSNATTTPLSSQTDDDHELLYEELMNQISSYLNNVTSAINKEDVMKNTKVNLQKLYNKSWSKEYLTCQLEHGKSSQSPAIFKSQKESIVQDPLDYIRLKHFQQQSMCDSDGCCSDIGSKSPQVAEVAVLQSPLTFRREENCNIHIYDTPEYSYYPHRLTNENAFLE